MRSFHSSSLHVYCKGIDPIDLVLSLVDNYYLDIVRCKDFEDTVDIVVHMDFVDIVVVRCHMDIVDYCKDLDNLEHLDMVGLELVDKYCHNLAVVLVARRI